MGPQLVSLDDYRSRLVVSHAQWLTGLFPSSLQRWRERDDEMQRLQEDLGQAEAALEVKGRELSRLEEQEVPAVRVSTREEAQPVALQ